MKNVLKEIDGTRENITIQGDLNGGVGTDYSGVEWSEYLANRTREKQGTTIVNE